MITFKSLKYKNFLSFGNTFTEIRLDDHRSTLIVGENGAGKSTLLDALCFVLFGKSYRNINKPTLINSINNKNLVVEIEFSTNNKLYKIVRGIKPNIFEIWQDNNLVDQKSNAKDYQNFLEQYILKMNFKSFTQIVILGTASFTPFMQLAASDRRAVIEDLLDIQIFSVMNTVSKQKLQSNKEETDDIRYHLKVSRKEKHTYEEILKELHKNNKSLIFDLQESINEINEKIDKEKKDIGLCENLIDEYTKELIDTTSIEEKHQHLIGLRSKIESNLTKEFEFLKFLDENEICPTCQQAIDKEHNIIHHENSKGEIEKYENGLNQIDTKIEELKKKIIDLKEISHKLSNATHNKQFHERNLQEFENDLLKCQSDIERLKDTSNDKLIASSEIKLNAARKEIEDYNDSLEQVLEDREYYDLILSMLKDGGIKTRIIKQYLPVMNKHINKYLADMNFFVNFTINENFEETIKSRYRDMFSYENFSEGEKLRIDLALLFTWRIVAKMKNSVSTNLLILDEIFDSSLDANGTDEFLKIMNTLGEKTNVFVISHKGDQLIDKFQNMLKFKKVKGFSRIIED